MVGHVRVHQSLADAVVRKSGKKGIIITQTQVTDRPSEFIRWIPKGEQDDETYFRSRSPLRLQRGKASSTASAIGSDLGILRVAGQRFLLLCLSGMEGRCLCR